MPVRSVLLSLFSLFLALVLPFCAQAAPQKAIVVLVEQASLTDTGLDRLSVEQRLRDTADGSQSDLVDLFTAAGARVLTRLWITNAMVVSAEPEVLETLRQHPAVESVELDRMIPLPEVHEEPMPAQADEIVWSIQKVNAPRVWSELGFTGKGVRVGLIDTGIDPNHPDLAGKVAGFKDFVTTANTTPQDGQGHGTHCAGTIGGGANPGGGQKTGMAPDVKFYVARVFSAQGGSTAALLEAMQWVMDPDGNPQTDDAPHVVSNSWGSNSGTDKSFWNAVKSWRAANIFPSFAAGNAGPRPKTVGIPGGYPHSFAVGATDNADGIASFSSRGPVTWDGQEMKKPEVSAPGHNVVSCKDGGGYRSMSGTSMACPHLTGLVALLKEANPAATVDEIEGVLKESVVDLGDLGHDNNFGTGRIDAYLACTATRRGQVAGTIKSSEGQALAAKVTAAGGSSTTADASGKYRLSLKDGHHALTISAAGHKDAKREVDIVVGQTTTLDVTLDPVPTATLSGRVTAKVDGSPVKAKVRVVGGATVTSGADGSYSLRLPHGSHTIVVSSRRFATARFAVTLSGNTTQDVALDPAPATLVVNASGQANLASFYMTVLTATQGASQVALHDVATHGAIDSSDLLVPHETVVWFSGKAANALPDKAQAALAGYLADGGRLLLTGQDLSSGIASSAFFTQTLHAKLTTQMSAKTPVQGIGGDPIGGGFGPWSLQGGDGANNQTSPDALDAADSKAQVSLRWQTTFLTRNAALRVTDGASRIAYFGFGIESLASSEARKELITKSMAWLKSTARERATRLESLAGEARVDYLETLRGWTGYHEEKASAELDALVGALSAKSPVRDLLRRSRAAR